MINYEIDEVMKELFDSLKSRLQTRLEQTRLSSIVFLYCIKNVIKWIQIVGNHILILLIG